MAAVSIIPVRYCYTLRSNIRANPVMFSTRSSRRAVKCTATGSNSRQGTTYGKGFDHEPFWLSMVKDVSGSLRSLAVFLAEQPSQLKYIEWPSFQSTLKTATLTLILVALLIVALTSIDSSLCFILALLLRKAA